MMREIRKYGIGLIFFFLLSMTARAASNEDATALAKKSQNPVEKMVSVPFNNNFNFDYGLRDNTQYVLDVKPVIPFTLNDSLNLITRTIIPVVRQPNLIPGRGYINGIGDLNPSFFLSPAHPGRLIWGIGPTVIVPTATNKQIGQGKYSVGPSLVMLSMPGSWVIGFLTFNAWSVAGEGNRANVNEFELQYFINYNFPHGWYITSSPIITADWTAKAKNRWVVPVGIGGGHVFDIGRQPVNVSVQAYDNVKTPADGGPDWQLQLNVTLLFPEG
ncbi:MAG: hypothetical protein EPO11_10610 [Gammaproteobacteria bacterium]|nr:MAG: hypothetical protein EPO11_10610 [Gammaproteobacteria bacterium]